MGTIETIFENYKAAHNEETPQTKEQAVTLEQLEQLTINPYRQSAGQEIWDKAVELSRASEKSGFILGFKMAFEIMRECSL